MARTLVSAKGQVVIPKEVRNRLGWNSGAVLDVIETVEGVVLRRAGPSAKLPIDQALERLRGTIAYDGPRLSEADWGHAVATMVNARSTAP